MEGLGLWDLLTLKMEEAILTESSNAGTENIHLLLENFAKITAKLNEWKFERSSPETFLITFVDIKNSTELIRNYKNIQKIFEFLKIAVSVYNQILKSSTLYKKILKFTLFKLVGDGILFLTSVDLQKLKGLEELTKQLKQILEKYHNKIYYSYKNLGTSSIILRYSYINLKQNSNTLDFRVVGGIGPLYCINFKTQNGTLKECIGCPISYLVKKSKYIDTYKWFGKITPQKCKEIL